MKIANKISLYFLILVTLLTIIASSIFYFNAKDNLYDAIYAQMDIVVQEKARHIETYLEMLKVSVEQFSKSVVLENLLKVYEVNQGTLGDNKTVFDMAMKRLRRTKEVNPEIYEFLLLDKIGRIIASSDERSVGKDKSTDVYFIEGQKGTFIKDAYYSEELKERFIAIATPFFDSNTGKLLGVLAARVKLSGLDKIILGLVGKYKTGEIYIVNKYGYMITTSAFLKDTFLKQKVDTANFSGALTHRVQQDHNFKRFAAISSDYRGVEVLGTHHYIPEMQWYILAELDTSEAFRPLVVLHIIFLSILLIMPFCAYLLGVYLAKFITESIRKLHKGIEIIGEGNLEYRVGTNAKDEIGQLSRAFDKMRENLKNSTTSIVNLNQEIILRKKTEETLSKSEEEYRTLFIESRDAVMIMSSDSVFISGNPAAIKMFGCQGEEDFKSKSPAELSPEFQPDGSRSLDKSREMIMLAIEKGSNLFEWTHKRLDGVEFIAMVLLSKYEINGKTLLQATVRDITEHKQILEELKQKNIALEKLDQLKSDFVSIVSHELRTPLSITKEGISLVLDGVTGSINPKQSKILTTSKNNIDRLARIINSLLDISKIESSRVEFKKTSVNLVALIKNVVFLFAAKAQEKGIELRVELPEDQEMNLYVDEDRIIQVFTNLIGNALKFTEKGSVTVSLIEKQNQIEFIVSDTGIGIAPEDLPNVFNKFMQFGRVAGTGEKGTGLGLSIAKGLIELHRGQIRVESEANRGSKFIFTLPKYSIDQRGRDQIEDAIHNALRASAHFSLIVATLRYPDKLKKEISAEVLAELEKAITHELHRGKDLFLRFADEFIIILQDCNKNNGFIVQGRIQQVLRSYFSSIHLGEDVKIDFGSATYPDEGSSYLELINKARLT